MYRFAEYLMKLYHPSSRIQFGKHSGHSLSEIYRFFPTYIEFLVAYVPGFVIDVSEFTKLPPPTPYLAEVYIDGRGPLKVLNGNSISRTYQYLREGHTLPKSFYKFPKRTLKILELKRKGIYHTPKWKRGNSVLLSIPPELHKHDEGDGKSRR